MRELDPANPPVQQSGEAAAVKPGFRVKNVVKVGERFADCIWQRLDRFDQMEEQIKKLALRHHETNASGFDDGAD